MNQSQSYSTSLYLPLSASDEAHLDSIVALLRHHRLALEPEFAFRLLADAQRVIASSFRDGVLDEYPDAVGEVSVIGPPWMLRITFEPVEVEL